jgi:predicted regulator of Ras-like GTPase activity (Roadblock/LC7/MglB family)
MSERMAQLLRSLRDVEGVVGSLVWDKSGVVLYRDLPLDNGVIEEIGQRIARIYEAFSGAGDELDAATLVFAGHKLHLREIDSAFIAVLSQPRVNEPALKMALHVVGRGLHAELERIAPAPTVIVSRAPTVTVSPAPVQATATKAQSERRPSEPVSALRSRLERVKRVTD